MIPRVRAWRITFAYPVKVPTGNETQSDRFVVWAPTKRLAVLNARGAGLWAPIDTVARWPEADRDPVPTDLVRPF